jgi:3-mercaptopyruvate sulfurtransferase SseA
MLLLRSTLLLAATAETSRLPPLLLLLLLQGAVFFDWTKDAVDTSAGAPVQLQMQPDLLAAALEAQGVSRDRPVVVRTHDSLQHP